MSRSFAAFVFFDSFKIHLVNSVNSIPAKDSPAKIHNPASTGCYPADQPLAIRLLITLLLLHTSGLKITQIQTDPL